MSSKQFRFVLLHHKIIFALLSALAASQQQSHSALIVVIKQTNISSNDNDNDDAATGYTTAFLQLQLSIHLPEPTTKQNIFYSNDDFQEKKNVLCKICIISQIVIKLKDNCVH